MIAQTTPKPQNEVLQSGELRQNEDAILYSPKEGCFAVSDGAGGTGIFSGAWAKYLLANLPSDPIQSYMEMTQWLDAIWESFYEEKEVQLQKDGIRRNKFYQEGSAATLLVVWQRSEAIHWMSYGDTSVLWLGKEGKYKGSFPTRYLLDFTQFPYLVNWNDQWMQAKGFQAGTFKPSTGDYLLLASDALAQTLLLWAKGEARKEELPQGKTAEIQANFTENPPKITTLELLAELKNDFKDTIRKLHKEGYLLNDDCSLVGFRV